MKKLKWKNKDEEIFDLQNQLEAEMNSSEKLVKENFRMKRLVMSIGKFLYDQLREELGEK